MPLYNGSHLLALAAECANVMNNSTSPPPPHNPSHAAHSQIGGLGYNPAANPSNPVVVQPPSLMRRGVAWIIDRCLIVGFLGLLVFGVSGIYQITYYGVYEPRYGFYAVISTLLGIVLLLFSAISWIRLAKKGQTFGKSVTGLVVVHTDRDGNPPFDTSMMFLRAIVKAMIQNTAILFLVEIVLMARDETARKSATDWLLKSQVVFKQSTVRSGHLQSHAKKATHKAPTVNQAVRWTLVGDQVEFELPPQNRILVGSDQACDIVIHDPSVAAQHAIFELSPQDLKLMTLGSFVSVNDANLPPEGQFLKSGDLITLGTVELALIKPFIT